MRTDYQKLLDQHANLLTGRWITDLANTSAFLFSEMSMINWVGFYLVEEGKLFLGPFQGKPACTKIAFGRGVCGTAAFERKTIIVPDVDQFEGHIVCDSASRSEIVIPLIKDSNLLGVLDVDSQILNRFQKEDQLFLESIVKSLLDSPIKKG